LLTEGVANGVKSGVWGHLRLPWATLRVCEKFQEAVPLFLQVPEFPRDT